VTTATDAELLVSRAVAAVRAQDSVAATTWMARLALAPPQDVVEELATRIIASAIARGDRPVGSSPSLPDPREVEELVAALQAGDVAAVHEMVGHDLAEMLTVMVCALAALQD